MSIFKPETYDLVINEIMNPLSTLPKAELFQLIVVLSVMWTTILLLGMGSWLRWGKLVIVHVGVLITYSTFALAGSSSHSRLSNSEFGLPENHPPKSTDGDG